MRILIVDDEEFFLRDVKNILSKILAEYFEFVEALAVDEARSRINDSGTINLAIVDLYIPESHIDDSEYPTLGLDLIEYIKDNAQQQGTSQSLKIIAITQHGEDASQFDAIEVGADDYVEKHYNQEEMAKRLKNSLAKLGFRLK